jgi:hypothetical protein
MQCSWPYRLYVSYVKLFLIFMYGICDFADLSVAVKLFADDI